MTPEQKAAFINSQAAAAQAEIAGMQAENQHRLSLGHTIAYDAAAFAAVIDHYGLGHNTVVMFFRD